ncbi:Leucine-rich repeat-containing protein 7 [Varanus komodoensis]|nr:Leucine-rich repeat-containing protein 7 [Varanus komodoensis]
MLMLGSSEGKRRTGWQMMRWLDGVTGAQLFNCQALRKLSIPDNDLSSLPTSIASLVNLKELDISKNAEQIRGVSWTRDSGIQATQLAIEQVNRKIKQEFGGRVAVEEETKAEIVEEGTRGTAILEWIPTNREGLVDKVVAIETLGENDNAILDSKGNKSQM